MVYMDDALPVSTKEICCFMTQNYQLSINYTIKIVVKSSNMEMILK